MGDEHSGQDTESAPASGRRATDGLIDVAAYSTAQLRDLQGTIDHGAFPTNASNIELELARRAEGHLTPPPPAVRIEVQFTDGANIRAWWQALSRRLPLYGEGAVVVNGDQVRVQGLRIGFPPRRTPIEICLARDSIRNVARDHDVVHFMASGEARKFVFRAASTADAAALVAALPADRDSRFETDWSGLTEFNRGLAAIDEVAYVTPLLVIANIAVFIAMSIKVGHVGAFDQGTLIHWGGNFGSLTVAGEWWRLATATFLHGNVAHVAINMWALWSFGRAVERLYGGPVYACIYVTSGVIASLASIAWEPTRVSVGASGAIFAVLGAFLVFLSLRRTQVPRAVVRAQAPSVFVFTLFNLVSGAMATGVDNAAHVGGVVAGLLLGAALARPLTATGRAPLRPWQVAGVAMLVAAAFGLTAWQLRQPALPRSGAERFLQQHAWYVEQESANVRRWQELATQSSAGTLSDLEFGQRLEVEIVPFWERVEARLRAEAPGSDPAVAHLGAQVADYAHLRAAWAQALVSAARSGDRSWLARATVLAEQADLVTARLEREAAHATDDRRARALSEGTWLRRLEQFVSSGVPACVEESPKIGRAPALGDNATDGPALRHQAGCAAQAALRAEDFLQLERLLAPASSTLDELPDGSSRLSGAEHGLAVLLGNGAMPVAELRVVLSRWRRASPKSPLPTLGEALMYRAEAWKARGTGPAKGVSPQGWAVYFHQLHLAAAALEDAARCAASSPLWHELMLANTLDEAQASPHAHELFTAATAKYPQFMPLYGRMLRVLLPRWGGSYDAARAFITEAARNAGPAEGPALYARLYYEYAHLEGDGFDVRLEAIPNWNVAQAGFKALIAAHPRSDVPLNAYAYFACRMQDPDVYEALRPRLAGHVSSTVWSDDATPERCDRRIAARRVEIRKDLSLAIGAAARDEAPVSSRPRPPRDAAAVRAQVAAALLAAEPMRNAVTEYILEQKHLPTPEQARTQALFRRIGIKGAHVLLSVGGSVESTLDGGGLDGKSFSWVPIYRQGRLGWICAHGDVPGEYFGPECRSLDVP